MTVVTLLLFLFVWPDFVYSWKASESYRYILLYRPLIGDKKQLVSGNDIFEEKLIVYGIRK